MELSARELRIGNLVKIEGENHRLYDIFGTGQIGTIRLGINYMSNIGELQPIKLTEEWLLKFGFEDDRSVFFIQYNDDSAEDSYYEINLYCSPCGNWSMQLYNYFDKTNQKDLQYVALNPIKHVHSLQNLYFALTNTELTIN